MSKNIFKQISAKISLLDLF